MGDIEESDMSQYLMVKLQYTSKYLFQTDIIPKVACNGLIVSVYEVFDNISNIAYVVKALLHKYVIA